MHYCPCFCNIQCNLFSPKSNNSIQKKYLCCISADFYFYNFFLWFQAWTHCPGAYFSNCAIRSVNFYRKSKHCCKKNCIFFPIVWNCASTLLLTLLMTSIHFILPIQIKREILTHLGISVRAYKTVISARLYRYSRIFSNKSYPEFQHLIWPIKAESGNPDTGWDTRRGINVFPLSGANVEIVPVNSIGYKMDSTTESVSWNNNAYSYTDISCLFRDDLKKKNSEKYTASVYCFVSEDFDGNWVTISDKDGAFGKIHNDYDLLGKRGHGKNFKLNMILLMISCQYIFIGQNTESKISRHLKVI